MGITFLTKCHIITIVKIVIVGAGFTGTQLAQFLILERHDVSLIEADEEAARHASNRLDCLVIHDKGSSFEALEEAGITTADVLICVAESEEVNMIICGIAESLNPKLLTIARVWETDYKDLDTFVQKKTKQKIFGIDHFIHPDIEASKAAQAALTHGASGNILAFPGTSYELASVNIKEGSAFDGLSLIDFHSFVDEEGLITLVERGKDCFLPTGSTKLCPGDLIYIITRKENMEQVFNLAGRNETALKRIGIIGGGRLGSLIAEGLLNPQEDSHSKNGKNGKGITTLFKTFMPKNTKQVTIIEQNYNTCKELAARFPDALVLNEDITDENFVAEEKIGSLDLIITATQNQELNIVTALFLKSRGVRRAIAMVSSPGYKTIALQLGVDVAIPVKSVVVDSILSHLPGRRIHGLHSLGDGSIGIVEITINNDSPSAGKPISSFKLSSGGLIILVNRGDKSFIPQGNYVFTVGDKIIIIAKNGNDAELEKFFGR